MEKSPHELSALIVPSEKQEIHTQGNTNQDLIIFNPFVQLNVPFVKTTQNLSFSILFFGLDKDKHSELEFYVMNNSEQQKAPGSTLKTQIPPFEENLNNINFNIELKNVVLFSEGQYTATLLVDGNLIAETFFYVVVNEQMLVN